MTIASVASMWRAAGVSVVPILAKNRPAVRWREFQIRCPTLDEVTDWWGNGHPYGLAIICGAVSGGLEMCELEARALDSTALTNIANAADALGCGEAWDRISQGYTQGSPTGGLHMVYRISDHEVPGNEKIAHNSEGLVLAETRGEGGYFVGSPSPGSCHPSGEGWVLASGVYGEVPTITWDERLLVHQAIRKAFDESARDYSSASRPTSDNAPSQLHSSDLVEATVVERSTPVTAIASPAQVTGVDVSPGDDWSAQTDWAEVLEPAGWTEMRIGGTSGERFWVRPGKNVREGHSASTDYEGKPGLYVWSTSAGLPSEEPLSKLFVLAHYQFAGNMSAAAKFLATKGFGSRQSASLTLGDLDIYQPPKDPVAEEPKFTLDDVGNAMRLWYRVRQNFRYVHEEKHVYQFAGKQWNVDHTGALEREWIACTEEMAQKARETGDEGLAKWTRQSRSQSRINAAVSMLRAMEGATISASEMDHEPDLVNLQSGTYNILTQQQEPHQREHLMTRTMNASYDSEATCPKFDEFMEQVLPDPEVRRYVQRAVGYSLLGRADRRAFFLIYGPSGTGKSQFLSTMEYVFGQYGATAAEGTFRSKEGSGPNNDLHGLRGKRFVSTSETAENATFNENLLKRLTGRDQVVSRDLYQSNITWTPECSLWLATNHPPRFNSDDDAIWKRAKLVPFLTRFGTDVPEIPDYARRFLYAEANGILNWILAGLRDFLANGLGEPEAVQQAANQHREQSDSVVRFLDDQIADNVLVEAPEGTIRTQELYHLYQEWCRTSTERPLGSRRFINRLESTGRATYTRTSTQRVWKGVHRPGAIGWRGAGVYEGNSDN